MSYSKYLTSLMEKARLLNRTVVLPEGEDMRVLEAAHIIASEKVAKLIVLGNEKEIRSHFEAQGWSLDGIEIIEPETSPLLAGYTQLLYNLRKEKGLTEEEAAQWARNYNYFGTLMVKAGDADGMVSGANHYTSDTVRPALQIIKSAKKGRSVSSCMIMVSEGKPYFIGDGAIIINPTAREMADVALDTAEMAIKFGLEPKVAMLSYSTFGSGKGEAVDKVREATRLAKADLELPEYKGKNIKVDGEMQVDAALDEIVARKKAPDSEVAGHANILIFPNLETGNIGYKLLQRLGGCEAYGPMLLGLNAPVNDLSRGAKVEDIVGMIAVTCLQK